MVDSIWYIVYGNIVYGMYFVVYMVSSTWHYRVYAMAFRL